MCPWPERVDSTAVLVLKDGELQSKTPYAVEERFPDGSVKQGSEREMSFCNNFLGYLQMIADFIEYTIFFL